MRGIYWNVAYTRFIIFYADTKIYSNFEVNILYTGLIYHRDCPERMCFPVGDPYIQTSCSLRGRLEYTPLGLDGYWSIYGFKWRIIQMMNCTIFSIYIFLKTYQQYIHVYTDLLGENGLANICHTSQNKKHFSVTPAQPILMAAMLVKILTLCCWNPLSNCLWLSYFDNNTWIASILNLQLQILFTRNKMTTCIVTVAFYAETEFLFSYLALQWYTSLPPILYSPFL